MRPHFLLSIFGFLSLPTASTTRRLVKDFQALRMRSEAFAEHGLSFSLTCNSI
jgi:hypothetical protein